MANVFSSNHFRGDVWNEAGVTSSTDIVLTTTQANLEWDRTYQAKPGLHGRMRMVHAKMVCATLGMTSGDVIRPQASNSRGENFFSCVSE